MTDPMRKAFDRYKSAYKGAVLFFRLGDVYEVFYEDAEIVRCVFGEKRVQIKLAEVNKYITVLQALGNEVQIVTEREP